STSASVSRGLMRIASFAPTGGATCAPGANSIRYSAFLKKSSANIAPINRASHGVVRMEDNGPAKAQADVMIPGSFLTQRRILSVQTRNTLRIDRLEVLPASSSMDNGSNQRPGNKHVLQLSRPKLVMPSSA